MSFPRPDDFLDGPVERLTKAARLALHAGAAELAAVTVTRRAGVAVHPDEVDVMLPSEVAEFEKTLLAREGAAEVDEYEVERGVVEATNG